MKVIFCSQPTLKSIYSYGSGYEYALHDVVQIKC